MELFGNDVNVCVGLSIHWDEKNISNKFLCLLYDNLKSMIDLKKIITKDVICINLGISNFDSK